MRDTEIHILSNLQKTKRRPCRSRSRTASDGASRGVSDELAQTLNGEPNTLGYPKAALFAFCLALVASNAMALIRASVRQIHGP